jgi:hypothetical protein
MRRLVYALLLLMMVVFTCQDLQEKAHPLVLILDIASDIAWSLFFIFNTPFFKRRPDANN